MLEPHKSFRSRNGREERGGLSSPAVGSGGPCCFSGSKAHAQGRDKEFLTTHQERERDHKGCTRLDLIDSERLLSNRMMLSSYHFDRGEGNFGEALFWQNPLGSDSRLVLW